MKDSILLMFIPLVFSQYQGSSVLGQQDPKYVSSSHNIDGSKNIKKSIIHIIKVLDIG